MFCLFSFMGKAIIELPPQEVYDAIRNPNMRFTYDNMLKVWEWSMEEWECDSVPITHSYCFLHYSLAQEVHIVKQIEDGLYVCKLN